MNYYSNKLNIFIKESYKLCFDFKATLFSNHIYVVCAKTFFIFIYYNNNMQSASKTLIELAIMFII